MKRSRFAIFAIMAIALLLCVLTCSVYAAAQPSVVTITITKTGISSMPKVPTAGDHTIIIKNMSSGARGLEMTGIDKAQSPYVRYSKVLRPGKSETFRWYFSSGKTIYVKDLLSCEHKSRTCVIATFGGMVAAITPM